MIIHMDYHQELTIIRRNLENFVNSELVDLELDYQTNIKIKKQVTDLIYISHFDPNIKDDEKDEIINISCRLLGEYTGCAEDLEILDEILEQLDKYEIIKEKHLEHLKFNNGLNRWL